MTSPRTRPDRMVRPRGVWGGTALGVLGAAIAGLGVILPSWPVALVGVAVLAGGGVLAVLSGGLYDVAGAGRVGTEARDVLEGNSHQGAAPGDQVRSPAARDRSRDLDERREAIVRQRARTPRPALAPLAAVVLLVVALCLLVSQGAFFPATAVGSANAERAVGGAIVSAAVGLRYLVSPGRHAVFALAGVLAAVGLILSGFLAEHDRGGTVAFLVTCGVVVLACSLVCLASPTRPGSERVRR